MVTTIDPPSPDPSTQGQYGQPSGDKRVVSAKSICVYYKRAHNSTLCNVVTDVQARFEVVKREKLCLQRFLHHLVVTQTIKPTR